MKRWMKKGSCNCYKLYLEGGLLCLCRGVCASGWGVSVSVSVSVRVVGVRDEKQWVWQQPLRYIHHQQMQSIKFQESIITRSGEWTTSTDQPTNRPGIHSTWPESTQPRNHRTALTLKCLHFARRHFSPLLLHFAFPPLNFINMLLK